MLLYFWVSLQRFQGIELCAQRPFVKKFMNRPVAQTAQHQAAPLHVLFGEPALE